MSLLSPCGYQSSSCGYCKDFETGKRTPESSASYYASAKSIAAEHYQSLIDRGWRRSGVVLYKPDLARSCCPHYTIRLRAANMHPSRAQRKVLNRWNRYVLGEEYVERADRRIKTKEEKARKKNGFDLIAAVHESEAEYAAAFAKPEHSFEVTLEDDGFTLEKYKLFEQYQRIVHKEPPHQVSKMGFRRFLCSSPLARSKIQVDGVEQLLGSYHQMYRLDGKLIAMAVLDLLPHGVSAVYFIYDVELEKYGFGKVSALREAALTIEGKYEYYYMGYYIHSCSKMRYKNDYKPQYVLDAETNDWHLLDDGMLARMDAQRYVFASDEQQRPEKPEQGGDGRDLLSPAEAANSGLSIFDLQLCGIVPLDDLKQSISLDEVNIMFRHGDGQVKLEVRHLKGWSGTDDDFNNPQTLRGIVAEFVAALGTEVGKGLTIAWS